jgi:hypothetical protein
MDVCFSCNDQKSIFFKVLSGIEASSSRSIDLIGLPLFIVRAGCVFQFDQGFDIGGNSLFPGSTKLHMPACTLARMQVCDIWHGIKSKMDKTLTIFLVFQFFHSLHVLFTNEIPIKNGKALLEYANATFPRISFKAPFSVELFQQPWGGGHNFQAA